MTYCPWLLVEVADDGWTHAAPKAGGDTYCGQRPTFPVGGSGDPTCSGCKHDTRAWELKQQQGT
jgi:hypothetical protein